MSGDGMAWECAAGGRFDRAALRLADRHYSRQQPGTPQFVAPGNALVLLTPAADALWVTRRSQYAKHEWPGAWECATFRNERPRTGADPDGHLSSEIIAQAVAVTRYLWGEPPAHGIITTVDPARTRRKRDPGRCYRKAGWRVVGRTKDRGLIVLQQLPQDMPEPCAPLGMLPFEAVA